MRMKWFALAGAVSLFAFSHVSRATTLTFTGATGVTEDAGSETVPVYPYNFTVNGSSAQLMCLNFNRVVTQDESWTVKVETIPEASGGNSALRTAYEEDAWLFSQINPSTTAEHQALVQFAVWDILDPADVSNSSDSYFMANASAIQDLIAEAAGALALENGSFFNQFRIYVPDQPSYFYSAQNGYPDGVPQTFIGLVSPAPAPEPGSLALLGTGLLGMGGILRRRIRNARS